MDDIFVTQSPNSPNSPSKIKEILLQISNINYESEKNLQKLEDNGSKYNEILKEVSTLKEEYEAEKLNFQKKQKEFDEYNYILQNLKKDKTDLDVSLKELETKQKTLKNTKPNLKDEELLKCGKQKHNLYKKLTGVRWNYGAPEGLIEGYITNKKDFLENISYKNDIDIKTVRDLLWMKIYQSSTNTSKNEFKENEAINK